MDYGGRDKAVGGKITITWSWEEGRKLEGVKNYGSNVVSFNITAGRRWWYMMG